MITKQQLIDLTRITHFKPHQQEKHYIQTLILNSIYSTITDEMVFKGGTCLLFFHGLKRFSEDLDFTLIKDTDIKKIILNIGKDLETIGIQNKISPMEENDTSISFKIGVEGPLYTKEIERCFVKIDISKREEVSKFEILDLKTNYKEILSFSVPVMSKQEILSEKVRAIITRDQARDVYDLNFLLDQGVKPDIALINKKLSYYKKEFNHIEFKKALMKKEKIWISELTPFILEKIPDFKQVKKFILKKFQEVIKK